MHEQMEGGEIELFLKHLPVFGGVFSIDEIANLPWNRIFVVNSKPSYHRGEHWFCLDLTGKGPYLFDSFGNSAEYYGLPSMKYWNQPIQDSTSNTCGLHCIFYIVHKSKGYSPDRMFKHFSSKIGRAHV